MTWFRLASENVYRIVQAPVFTPGQQADYFSDTQQQWFECTIIGLDAVGGIRVNIQGNERTVQRERIATHLRTLQVQCSSAD